MVVDSSCARVQLSRRTLIAGGIAALAATRAFAIETPVAVPAATPLSVPVIDALPIDKARLIMVARQQLDRQNGAIWLRDKVGLVDFSRPSRDPRLFIINMLNGDIKPYLVTHGKGSDHEHDGWLKTFSDDPGSLATSRGAYVTRQYYEGKHGLSMRLQGLDPDNRSAEDRAIVVHGAKYADPERIAEMGKLGRSEGCFALPQAKLFEVIAHIGAGRLLFADKL
ncbi:MAG: murein L,D-transpeptidase catalytic domain family protein [Sphingomonadaceae bacterium]